MHALPRKNEQDKVCRSIQFIYFHPSLSTIPIPDINTPLYTASISPCSVHLLFLRHASDGLILFMGYSSWYKDWVELEIDSESEREMNADGQPEKQQWRWDYD